MLYAGRYLRDISRFLCGVCPSMKHYLQKGISYEKTL